MKQIHVTDEFITVDLETTGLSRHYHHIIEIGAMHYRQGALIEEYSTLVNPYQPLPSFISRLTGISDEMIEHAPDLIDVIGPFLDFIGDLPLVLHNASFDLGFLDVAVARYNGHHETLSPRAIRNPIHDTLTLCRKLFPRSAHPRLSNHRLGTLAEYFNLSNDDAHRALNDCRITAGLYMKCKEEAASLI